MKYACLAFLVALTLGVGLFSERPASAKPTMGGEPAARSSAQVYSRYCASCHGRDGGAKTRRARTNHARNLNDAEWQDRVSDERIFNSIMNGKGKMPAYSKKLSEKEIDDLVNFVRRLRK